MKLATWKTGAAAMVAILAVAMGWGSAYAQETASSTSKPADQQNPHLWQPKVKSVAVFKNGLGFFMREGDVALRDGWCMAKEVPPAAFGTLAIFSHSKDHTVDVVGSGPGEVIAFDGKDAPNDTQTKRRRLGAMENLNIQVTYKHGDAERTAAGKLKGIEARFAIVESDSNSFAVPLEEVTRVQVLDLPIRVHVLKDDEKPADKTTLGMAYLRKGITWVPEYTLNVIDEETAELTLRGTIVNEAEDLVHTDIHFVVGVPHFTHTDYMAPIAVGQMIRTIGAAVAPQQVMSQIANRSAIFANANRSVDIVAQPVEAAGGDVNRALGNLPQLEGAAATDYTVYTKKDLTLRCGEKAIVTLFKKKIKYSHIYRWTLPKQMEHMLALQNATDTAWTTGPCLVISNEHPLGEDLLKYVPKGATGEIPITTAINIATDSSESETDRKLKAHNPSTDFYLDLVTISGKITLKNFEKRAATVVVTTPIAGKPREASDEGVTSLDTANLQLLQRKGEIRWRVKLEPNETKTVTYTYERYVPSR